VKVLDAVNRTHPTFGEKLDDAIPIGDDLVGS
jgi:hypothetical protein